jgi:hypothetical protein
MSGLTNYITQRPWLDTVTSGYVQVEDAYQAVVQRYPALTRRSGPPPRLDRGHGSHPAASARSTGGRD